MARAIAPVQEQQAIAFAHNEQQPFIRLVTSPQIFRLFAEYGKPTRGDMRSLNLVCRRTHAVAHSVWNSVHNEQQPFIQVVTNPQTFRFFVEDCRFNLGDMRSLNLVCRHTHAVLHGIATDMPGIVAACRTTTRQIQQFLSAAKRGDVEAVLAALAARADVNTHTKQGWTPLHYAVKRGSPIPRAAQTNARLVQILLAHGANIEARNNEGQTPLHFAASRGNTPAMQALLDAGADINALDEQGRTPLDLDTSRGAFLRTKGAKSGKELADSV